MKFELKKEPKEPVVIEGFPGFGFVSTICTGFLIEHLKAKKIGKIVSDEIEPVAAINGGEIIDPIEIFYAKKDNIIILRTLGQVKGHEWELADIIKKLARKLGAREVISLEGVPKEENISGENKDKSAAYYFTDQKNKNKGFEKTNIEKFDKGVIRGVTAALLLKMENMNLPFSSIFAKASSELPDSRAAGEVIKALDEYLELKVDYDPLFKTAEKMEKKIKEIVKQAEKGDREKVKGKTDYLG